MTPRPQPRYGKGNPISKPQSSYDPKKKDSGWVHAVEPASQQETSARPIRALLVEDHQLFAEAVRLHLQDNGVTVIDVTDTHEDALEAVRQNEVDLALVDLNLPGASGIDIARSILEESPDVKVIAVTGIKDSRIVGQALQAGFHGYLTKDTPLEDFVRAINDVLEGVVVTPQKLNAPRRPASEEERAAALLANHLTPRELEVLELLVAGATSEEMAESLTISPNTVRTHVQSILTKLQVRSRLGAATFAVRHGIVKPKETP